MRASVLIPVLLSWVWLLPAGAVGQTADILIDGYFNDWLDKEAIYADPQDQPGGGIDFERVWAYNDDRYLYLSIVIGVDEISLQNESSITLYLDTDNDAESGQSFGDIGADLVWVFGDRGGTFYGDAAVPVRHRDIGLIPAPTMTSNRFELALELEAEPRRQGPLFPNDTIAVAFAASSGEDVMPEPGDRIEFLIDRSVPARTYTYDLDREIPSDLRVLAWNVEQDGLFESNLSNDFGGLLRAIDPDIIGFSEIYDHTPGQTLDRLETLLPSGDGESWHGDGSGFDVVLASRYPLSRTFKPLAAGSAGAFLIDLSNRGASEMLVVATHLRCCDQDVRRQAQIDEVMAFIRDVETDGTLLPETPIVVLGDMNFVGDSRQLATLIEGNIVNARFQPSFDPDWDGSAFTDRIAPTTGVPGAYTWPGRGDEFAPGRLDYVVFSDFVLETGRAYSLSTETIPLDELQRLGLSAAYTIRASDHLPVVADFRGSSLTATEAGTPAAEEGPLLEAFPNPATQTITLELRGDLADPIVISVVDVLGRTIARVPMSRVGRHRRAKLSVADFPPGLYIFRAGTASVSQVGALPVTIR